MELAFEKLLPGGGSCSKRHPQELVSASGFHILLVEQVEKQVLVSLDEPLRVNLSVLQLLVSVSLDALEQCGKGLLLTLTKQGFLFLNGFFKKFLSSFCLLLLHLLALKLEQLGFFVDGVDGPRAHVY